MATLALTATMAGVINKLEQLQVDSGVVGDLKQLQRKSTRIQALVDDAENLELHDSSTKLWLAELSEVVSEAQDLVDELEYEIVRAQVDYHGHDDHHLLQSCSSSVRYTNLPSIIAHVIADKLQRINGSFDEIFKYRRNLRLTCEDGTRRPDWHPKYPLHTSHMVNTSQVYGREQDKKKIVDWLIADDTKSNPLAVISVVGKGGIGKTTVAQLVYNDAKLSEHFDQKLWICVTLDFDVIKLTRAVVEAVTKKPCNFVQLDMLQDALQGKLAGSKVLLVLDDVWNLQKSSWELFRTPFLYGKQFVRIVVTTRNEVVCSVVEAAKVYHLRYLPNDVCWELFKTRAFCGRDSGLFPHLEDIGKRIVRKSSGLPLVVKSLGGILQYSTDEERWKDVLESRLWEIGDEHAILPILHLSYNYLPYYLKPLFLSCLVFPKDYELVKDEVVSLWIALGFIQNKSRSLEDEGNAYFDELHKRSFFDVGKSFWHKGEIFKMHDSIHDLALYVSLNGCSATSTSCLPNSQSTISRVLVCDTPFSEDSFSSLVGSIKHLRFLVLKKVVRLPESLHSLYNLRVLVIISSYSTSIKLPEQIENLINLLYLRLNLSYSYPITLPESICRLYNLETLDMGGSMFKMLPSSITNLDKLRHLSLRDTRLLNLPVGFGKLLKLERLYFHQRYKDVNVNEIRELKHLVKLKGTLCIVNIKDMSSIEDAKEANLKNKPQIDDLRLSWSNSYYGWGESYRCCDYKHLHLIVSSKGEQLMQIDDEDVLDSLRPHNNLRSFTILHYGGVRFPTWLGHRSFTKLAKIYLIGCMEASKLPTLGQLPFLQYLQIKGFSNVKSIGHEFFRYLPCETGLRTDRKVAFPSLLKLEFHDMTEWEEWHGVQDQDFPKLHELRIIYCPNLSRFSAVFYRQMEKINRLYLFREPIFVGAISILKDMEELEGSLYIFELRNVLNAKEAEQANMGSKCQIDELVLDFGPRKSFSDDFDVCLEACWDESNYLHVNNYDIQSDVLESLQPNTNLRKLQLYEYCGVSFPQWIGDPLFTKLAEVVISGCDNTEISNLPTLGQLPSLGRLKIQKMLCIRTIGEKLCRFSSGLNKVAFPSLKELEFHDMPELQEWGGVLDDDFPRLKRLQIINCLKLSTVPSSVMKLMNWGLAV